MSLKAKVYNGRLVLDEPTDLPDGTIVELLPADWDGLDDADRQRLHDALAESEADALAGRVRPAGEILDELQRA